MPVPSTIKIYYEDQDITDKVLFHTARFDGQANGGVGTFSFQVKDSAMSSSFVTGKSISMSLDNVWYFGGYLMQVGGQFAFPVVDTTDLGLVTARQYALSGVNYNVLFDRLVVRNPADYLTRLPIQPGNSLAGRMVKDLVANYLDVPYLNVSQVDDVGLAGGQVNLDLGGSWSWVKSGEQGVTWRDEMRWVSQFLGSIYYIDANANLHYHAPEKVFSRWGFSDRPNHRTVLSSQTKFTGATYGFREMETTEDITSMVNDIFVWGGSPFIASTAPLDPSGTVFARRTNDASVTRSGRWQARELKFGVLGLQAQVDSLADAIVPPDGSDAPPGVSLTDGVIRNQSVPNKTLKLVWYAHDVPTLETGAKDHLIPGQVVNIALYVHGTDITHPLILTLPLRRVTVTFPTTPGVLDPYGNPLTYARFEGEFGLSLDDPWNIWSAILDRQAETLRTVNAAGSTTTEGAPGGVWQGAPDELPDGSRKVFTLSSNGTPIAYTSGSSEVYLNGLRLRIGADYSEQPLLGTFTMFTAPPAGSVFVVYVRLVG